jgi:hypothetical protein
MFALHGKFAFIKINNLTALNKFNSVSLDTRIHQANNPTDVTIYDCDYITFVKHSCDFDCQYTYDSKSKPAFFAKELSPGENPDFI